MTKEYSETISLDERLGCYGSFNIQDPICKRFCALRLRCLIDRDQNHKLELLEDLISSEFISIKIQ